MRSYSYKGLTYVAGESVVIATKRDDPYNLTRGEVVDVVSGGLVVKFPNNERILYHPSGLLK